MRFPAIRKLAKRILYSLLALLCLLLVVVLFFAAKCTGVRASQIKPGSEAAGESNLMRFPAIRKLAKRILYSLLALLCPLLVVVLFFAAKCTGVRASQIKPGSEEYDN